MSFLAEDSELRFFWSTQDPRPLIAQEYVIHPSKVLRVQDFEGQQLAALKYAMIRFPESVCEKAYAKLEPGQNYVIEQVSAVLGIPEKRLQEFTDESAKARYRRRETKRTRISISLPGEW